MKKIMNNALFSQDKNDWETPKDFFEELDKEFNFDLDVCASQENTKCLNYFDEKEDGLKQEWFGVCWCNPPYKTKLQDQFLKKAKEESFNGVTTVLLLPARTDTKRFFEYCWDEQLQKSKENTEVRFIKGRLKF